MASYIRLFTDHLEQLLAGVLLYPASLHQLLLLIGRGQLAELHKCFPGKGKPCHRWRPRTGYGTGCLYFPLVIAAHFLACDCQVPQSGVKWLLYDRNHDKPSRTFAFKNNNRKTQHALVTTWTFYPLEWSCWPCRWKWPLGIFLEHLNVWSGTHLGMGSCSGPWAGFLHYFSNVPTILRTGHCFPCYIPECRHVPPLEADCQFWESMAVEIQDLGYSSDWDTTSWFSSSPSGLCSDAILSLRSSLTI